MTPDVFPSHAASLTLEHNDHKSFNWTVERWWDDIASGGVAMRWVSEEQKRLAFERDEVWTLQWYPRTPLCFHYLAAADLSVLLEAAKVAA